ncbi:MAG: dTDP-4-dehydrorhamnose 3,5-epimerase [Bdellovibrionales bacterium RBG_16_40_8]|nr:MAG: dTDP-4-dehydrorhamnose 3,5-epimerase [Bdellovibrionales bacterium RBG_16_40_8]
MEILKTELPDLVLIKPKVFGDARGFFLESYNAKEMLKNGFAQNFVQDNQSVSSFGTLRGLHYQRGEYAQAKILRVIQGRILDVVVDLRPDSITYKKSYAVELSAENYLQIFVPRQFAHGFVVLSESATVVYKCDNYYSPEHEGGIYHADPELQIDWRIPQDRRILSAKDQKLPSLKTVIATKDWIAR